MLSTKLVGVALEKPGSGFAPIDTVKPPQQYFPTLLLLRMRRTMLRMTNNIYFSTFFLFHWDSFRRMSGDAGDNFGGWLRADGIVESHRIPIGRDGWSHIAARPKSVLSTNIYRPLKNITTIISLPCASPFVKVWSTCHLSCSTYWWTVDLSHAIIRQIFMTPSWLSYNLYIMSHSLHSSTHQHQNRNVIHI